MICRRREEACGLYTIGMARQKKQNVRLAGGIPEKKQKKRHALVVGPILLFLLLK